MVTKWMFILIKKINPKAQALFTKSELEEILPEGAEILASCD